MGRLIVSAILLVLLAVLLSFNLQFYSSVSLFGLRLDGVPVAAISLLSFAAGVVYSLFLYVGRSLRENRKKGLEKRRQELTERERLLEARAAESAAAGSSHAGPPAGDSSSRTDEPGPAPRRRPTLGERLKRLF